MKPFIIVVDVGNTSSSLALARCGQIARVAFLPTLAQTRAGIQRALTKLIGRQRISGSALCSVVPAKNKLWLAALARCAPSAPLLINHRLRLGLSIDYPRPDTIGADRLANASAAAARYGTPVVVADFGTLLTFDVVSRAGAYLGGIIAPSAPLLADYMAERTALLPRINLCSGRRAPRLGATAIGKSTEQAMAIGVWLSYQGLLRETIQRLKKSLREPRLRCCATGGYASWALAGSPLAISIEPRLTLYGISRIYHLNNKTGAISC